MGKRKMGKSKSRSKRNKKRFRQEQDKEQVHKREDGHEQDQGNDPERPSESVDEFSSFVKGKINDLIYIVSTHHGLLDELVSENVLTSKQVLLIEEKELPTGRVRRLLEEITGESISDEKKEAFFKALDKTQHKHVSNLIRGKGERAAEYGDVWPLYCCEEFRRMTDNRYKLIELIDSRNGLLDLMLSAFCISHHQKHSVEEHTTDENQNKTLYAIVLWGSLATYKTFIRCLLETNQHQVVSLLAPSLVEDVGLHPLSDNLQSQIQRNYATLVHIINSMDGLTAELFSSDCITWRQKEFIESASRQSESNKRLIDIVRRGSETNFHKFTECLDKTGQRHVSRILVEDGAVAYIVATISPADNREQRERRIVEQLTALLRDIPDERREVLVNEALAEARQSINQLRENEVTMLAAQIGHSIGLFYFTTSLRGLQYLYEIYSNEQLKSIMQEIFIVLLTSDDAVLDLSVDSLRWDLPNYTDCVQQLCTFANLPILSHVYEMAKQNQQLAATCFDVRSLPIDQFPFELIEMILVRAAGQLFVTINRSTPRAEVYALATLTAVSRLWWVALSYRKYIKRFLKRSFKRVCHPFKCSPQQVTSLHIEGGKNVWGVAVSNNELFVTCGESNRIQVFDCRPPFSRQDDIQLQELGIASDVAICTKSNMLYVADRGAQCAIWRVSILAIKRVDKFLSMQWRPISLSVSNGRLLITPLDGDSLYLHGDDGKEMHHIELPRYMTALHAVETPHKTYLVCHRKRLAEDTPDSVTEVDVNGRVIRSFSGDFDQIQLNWPRYLVLDNNHVIIADCYNDRIVLLDSDLQFKRVLMKSLHTKRPHRLCLTSSRLLAVSYVYSTDIDIFQV